MQVLQRGYRIPWIDSPPPLSACPIPSYAPGSAKVLTLAQETRTMLEKDALQIVISVEWTLHTRIIQAVFEVWGDADGRSVHHRSLLAFSSVLLASTGSHGLASGRGDCAVERSGGLCFSTDRSYSQDHQPCVDIRVTANDPDCSSVAAPSRRTAGASHSGEAFCVNPICRWFMGPWTD